MLLKKYKTLALTVFVIAFGIGASTIMKSFATKAPVAKQVEPEITVAVIPALISSYRPSVTLIGQIEAKDEATLTSPLETEVLEVFAEVGDFVAKGDQLIKLDTRDTLFQLEAQLAGLEDIDAQLDSLINNLSNEVKRIAEIKKLKRLADEALDRNRTLLNRGVISQTLVDQSIAAASSRNLEIIGQEQKIDALETSRRRFEASKRVIQSKVSQLRLTIERARLEAPFDGVVKVMTPSAGTRIGRGATLVQIYSPNSLRLRAAIPNEYATDALDNAVEAEITIDGKISVALLDSVAPEAKAGRGSVDALFALPTGRWLLGAAVEFNLILPMQDQSVAVPFDSLYAGSRIYVVDAEKRAQALECVNNGQTNLNNKALALLSCPDLKTGDEIITSRIPNLISGTKLKISAS